MKCAGRKELTLRNVFSNYTDDNTFHTTDLCMDKVKKILSNSFEITNW